jgi:adenylosuccinate synthase
MDEAHPLSVKLKLLEFGTSTGRQRMVGWYDAVEKGDALRYGGFQDLMINKLDALTWSGEWRGDLQICVGYEDRNRKPVGHVPRNEAVRKALKPVYRAYPGWAEDISGVRKFADLPQNARRYVGGMVKSILDVAYEGHAWPRDIPNLRYLGVGPAPSQLIKDLPTSSELAALG